MKSLLLFLLLIVLAAAPAPAEIYTWKQGGSTHYTNQPDTIPPRYRSKAKVLALPGEVTSGQAAQTPGQTAPSLSPLPLPPPPPAAVSPQVPSSQERKSRRGRRSAEDE